MALLTAAPLRTGFTGSMRVALRGVTILCSLIVAATARAQTYQEHDVKAAFIYNFTKFITWPAGKTTGGTLNVCLIGEDPFGSVLDTILHDKAVRGLRVVVLRYKKTEELAACHVVFVGISTPAQFQETLLSASRYNFLTVGESDGFAEKGGMIGFIIKNGHVQFVVNLEQISRGDLQVSSNLLELALIVQGRK